VVLELTDSILEYYPEIAHLAKVLIAWWLLLGNPDWGIVSSGFSNLRPGPATMADDRDGSLEMEQFDLRLGFTSAERMVQCLPSSYEEQRGRTSMAPLGIHWIRSCILRFSR
jgi:hypothetical protein